MINSSTCYITIVFFSFLLFLILAGKYIEQIQIDNNATGYSYEKVFGRFIDESLTEVEVQDPYIRSIHQVGVRACLFACI